MFKIIAEISANHLGSLDRAMILVDAAAAAGADAVKVQAWDPARMVVDARASVVGGPWDGRNLQELYQEAHTPWIWIPQIFAHAQRCGMIGFASVFDTNALAMLQTIDCPIYKIASCEIVDLPLIRAVARTGKPMVISTGMATQQEIHDAVDAAIDVDGKDLTLLKCTAAYPASIEDCHLQTIPDMRKRYALRIGLSDHTLGMTAAVVATALGATMIEKHLTLARAHGGPDAGFSSEPHEFAAMVTACRQARAALGAVRYGPTEGEVSTLALRRSLHYAKDLPSGHIITEKDVVSARPATGLPHTRLTALLGLRLKAAVQAGQPIRWEGVLN